MKNIKILYWLFTLMFSLWMLLNARAYLTNDEAKVLCRQLGFPDYFRVELAIAKTLGALVLLIPWFKGALKEWAYAGFAFTVISGLIAHVATGDPIGYLISALIALSFLLISYVTYHRLQKVDLRWIV
ncbi:DoxX family protein [Mucilaginibacter gynuensis]|uniref:DoxX family protein n=1 Tax=Mucilaginibacter gynuensis TaxID=1302236 RepID=A0ABP8GLZ0_9SPHI